MKPLRQRAGPKISYRDVFCFLGGIIITVALQGISLISSKLDELVNVQTGASSFKNESFDDRRQIFEPEPVVSHSLSPSLVVQEIFPESLQPAYAPEKLLFNVTRNMLQRSRPVIGNTQRLHFYINKLHSKQCTIVLILGGSVTDGHNAGGPKNAYPKHFIDWLNEKYPCVADDGSPGHHELKKTHAQNSQSNFILWSTVEGFQRIDLAIIESNINDNFIGSIQHALEDKGKLADYSGVWYNEVLLRRLLLMKKPDPLAIVTFNADYVGRTWATFDNWYNPHEARKLLFRSNGEPMKNWISSLYEVPVFSATVWMIPLASKLGMKWQFNNTHNPYSTNRWHSDACCHPPPKGHLILSMVLAYCIAEEEKNMMSKPYVNFAKGEGINDINIDEHDFTLEGNLRDPVYLSPEEDELYVRNLGQDAFQIDFTDPSGETTWKNSVVENTSWKWYPDNADADKYGMIANTTEGGAHIALLLNGRGHGLIEISHVISYENFGIALAWVDNEKTNLHKSLSCNNTQDNYERDAELEKLTGYWEE
eukprot:CCRYP_000568-RA/>CCRYP_000568-RA protein AED:0.06 eAED:0.03 QI:0/0/0/1/1/1/2/0/536